MTASAEFIQTIRSRVNESEDWFRTSLRQLVEHQSAQESGMTEFLVEFQAPDQQADIGVIEQWRLTAVIDRLALLTFAAK